MTTRSGPAAAAFSNRSGRPPGTKSRLRARPTRSVTVGLRGHRDDGCESGPAPDEVGDLVRAEAQLSEDGRRVLPARGRGSGHADGGPAELRHRTRLQLPVLLDERVPGPHV